MQSLISTESSLVEKFIESYTGSNNYYTAEYKTTLPNGKLKYKYNFQKIKGVPKEITSKIYQEHLDGKTYLVLPPITKDGNCKFGAIDIDPYDGEITKEDCKKIVQRICNEKLPLNFVWSTSGGLHLYMYSHELISAQHMRNALAYYREHLNLPSSTEIFPKQTNNSNFNIGNGIKLPCHRVEPKFLQQHIERIEHLKKDLNFFLGFVAETKIITEDKIHNDKDIFNLQFSIKEIKDAVKKKKTYPGLGGVWDNWITQLVAKLIEANKSDKEILKQCLEIKHDGYTDEETLLDVASKIKRCRAKFSVEDPEIVREEFFNRIIYLLDPCKYFDLKKNKEYRPDAIKQDWSSKMGVADATTFFKNSRKSKNVEDFIYLPTKYDPQNPLLEFESLKYINKYRPHNLEAVEGDVSLFHTLMDHLFVDPKAKEFILDYIAIHIQQPGIKCRFAPIIQSTEFQIGKGSLWRCIKLMLGNNAQKVDVKEALDKAKDFLVSKQIVLIDEMKSSGKWEEREEMLNELKLFITEEEHSSRKLFVDYKSIITCTNFMFFTNFKNALTLPENEQRYWVYFCDVPRLNKNFYKEFHIWLENDGKKHLLYFFQNYQISDNFDPKDVAPESPNLVDMSKQAQRPLYAELEQRFLEQMPPFQDFRDLIPTTWLMAWCKKNRIKVARPNDLFPILESLGGRNIGQCEMKKQRAGSGITTHKLTMWIMRNHEKYSNMSNREIGQLWMDLYLSVSDGIDIFDDVTVSSNYTDRKMV